jgi:hypothetical protein
MSSNCICIVAMREPVLSDEDSEQDPDRWCSHSAWGQECWQVVSQWIWNLRLEVGHRLENGSLHRSRFSSPAGWDAPLSSRTAASASGAASRGRWQSARGVCGQHSPLPPVSAARAVSMEWERDRQASPGECAAASAPGGSRTVAATRDWSRREHRRACRQLVRHQRVEVSLSSPATASPCTADVILSRAQRAHSRLSWTARLARNVRSEASGQVTIKLFGVPAGFATALGLAMV